MNEIAMNTNQQIDAGARTRAEAQPPHQQPPGRQVSPASDRAIDVGAESGCVVLQFAKPVDWIALPPEEALEVAVSLLKHARRAGSKESLVWRVGDPRPQRALNPSDSEGGDL